MKRMKSLWIAVLLLMVSTTVSAQCTFRNTAFKSGEFLTYNLYYNWKFVWVKRWYSQHVYCAEYQEWQARLSHLIGDERKSQGR